MAWKWACGNEQATNALRFATKDECEAYGYNLGMRWFGMPTPALALECFFEWRAQTRETLRVLRRRGEP